MELIQFSNNWNGKLVLDNFGTVRLHNKNKYYCGNKFELMYKQSNLGIVEVVSVFTFPYRAINDRLSYVDIGKPAYYLASLLKTMYSKKCVMENDTKLDHVILHYLNRNIEAQFNMLRDWWTGKIEEQPAKNNQTLLNFKL